MKSRKILNLSALFVASMLALLFVSCQVAEDEDGLDMLFYKGRVAFDKGKFDDALELFQKVTKRDEKNQYAKVNVANIYSAKGGVDIFSLVRKLAELALGSELDSSKKKASGSSSSKSEDANIATLSGVAGDVTIGTKQKEKLDSSGGYETMKDLEKDFPELGYLSKSVALLVELTKEDKDFAPAKVNFINGINYLLRAMIFFKLFFDRDGDGQIDAMKVLTDLQAQQDRAQSGDISSKLSDVLEGISKLSGILKTFLESFVLTQFINDMTSSMQAFKAAGIPDAVTDVIQKMVDMIDKARKEAKDKTDQLGGVGGEGDFFREQIGSAVEAQIEAVYGGYDEDVPAEVTTALERLKAGEDIDTSGIDTEGINKDGIDVDGLDADTLKEKAAANQTIKPIDLSPLYQLLRPFNSPQGEI